MEPTATVEAPTPVIAPPVVETPAPPAESPSIADHSAQFDPEVPKVEPIEGETAAETAKRARDEQGRFARERRHRAHNSKATADDVPRIKALTGKWRSEETARKALEEKYAALEREIQTLKQPKVEPPPPPATFDGKEPALEDFAQSDDPYRDWMRALAKYDRQKEAAESSQAQHETAAKQYEAQSDAQRQAEYQKISATYNERQAAFMKVKPDWEAVTGAIQEKPTPLLGFTLLTDERGPEFVYTLASKPELLAEMMLVSEGKTISETSVAMMRRLLTARMQTAAAPAATGSVAPSQPVYTPPKPPNPVRTGPTKLSDDPGEAGSIAEHARTYGARR